MRTVDLDARPKAKAFFDDLTKQNRYAILYQLEDAKKPETRERRLRKLIEDCAAGRRLAQLSVPPRKTA